MFITFANGGYVTAGVCFSVTKKTPKGSQLILIKISGNVDNGPKHNIDILDSRRALTTELPFNHKVTAYVTEPCIMSAYLNYTTKGSQCVWK